MSVLRNFDVSFRLQPQTFGGRVKKPFTSLNLPRKYGVLVEPVCKLDHFDYQNYQKME